MDLAYDDRGGGEPAAFITGRSGIGRVWNTHPVLRNEPFRGADSVSLFTFTPTWRATASMFAQRSPPAL